MPANEVSYSVILLIKITEDHVVAEFNLLHQSTYELAQSWKRECEDSLINVAANNVAVKCLNFVQSIHSFPVYWELVIRA